MLRFPEDDMTTDAPRPGRPGKPAPGYAGPGPEERLRIELEDAASRKWWARILYTLGSQYGRTQLQFVARTGDGRRLYASDTFPGPPLNPTPPEEAWAPGMQASLSQLRRELARDGWSETSHGVQPWDLTFSRGPGR
ncbi:hypothetical protein FB478_101663 [Arthrobacter sp. AG367]|jgi:hypothetical protein|nr:hypothetical protein FB478_101663 [Arthrobacter sp. AG367]